MFFTVFFLSKEMLTVHLNTESHFEGSNDPFNSYTSNRPKIVSGIDWRVSRSDVAISTSFRNIFTQYYGFNSLNYQNSAVKMMTFLINIGAQN